MSQWGGYDEKYRSHFIDPMDPLFGKIQKDIWRNRLNFMEQTIYMALTLLMKSILLIGMRTSYVLYPDKIFHSIEQVDSLAHWIQMTWMFYHSKDKWSQPRIKAF